MEGDVDGYCPLGSVVAPSCASVRRAAQRRARKNEKHSLPRVFLVMDVRLKCLIGAMLVCHCFSASADTSELVWTVSRVVLLQEHIALHAGGAKYVSTIFELQETFELQVRSQAARCGGFLYSHFQDFLENLGKRGPLQGRA